EIIIIFDGYCHEEITKYVFSFLKKNFYKKYKVFKNKINKGITFSYNLAIKKASYDIVAIQDADDFSVKKRFYDRFEVLTLQLVKE
ncbi:uncharacterized protein METZ01_LOCUS275456, partial [marine metagenome]